MVLKCYGVEVTSYVLAREGGREGGRNGSGRGTGMGIGKRFRSQEARGGRKDGRSKGLSWRESSTSPSYSIHSIEKPGISNAIRFCITTQLKLQTTPQTRGRKG